MFHENNKNTAEDKIQQFMFIDPDDLHKQNQYNY